MTPKVLDIGQKLRVGKLNVIVTEVYRTPYITVSGEPRYPKDGRTFLIAQITLENTFGEYLPFCASETLRPSVDGTAIDLKSLSGMYPNYLDNAHNLVNRGTVTVNPDDSKKGFIMFDAPADFKSGEIACYDETGALAGSFAFDNLSDDIVSQPSQTDPNPSGQASTVTSQHGTEVSQPEESSAPEQTAQADGLTFTLLELTEDDGSKLGIEQYVDVNKFWQVRLRITNNTNMEKAFTYNDFAVVCGSGKHDTLFSSSTVETIPPGQSIEGDVIFAVEKTDSTGFLHYYSRGTKLEDHTLFLLQP